MSWTFFFSLQTSYMNLAMYRFGRSLVYYSLQYSVLPNNLRNLHKSEDSHEIQ